MASLRPNSFLSNNATAAPHNNKSGTNAASQFQAWAREKDLWLHQATLADQERVALEAHVKQLRATQQELTGRIQVTSDALGRVQRQAELLLKHKQQLSQQLQCERNELEQSAEELENLVATERKNKREYCESMKAMNDEWKTMLKKQEDVRLKQMISIDTVGLIVDSQRMAAFAETPSVQAELDSAIAFLKETTDQHFDALKHLEHLEGLVFQFRAQAKGISLDKDHASGSTQVSVSEDASCRVLTAKLYHFSYILFFFSTIDVYRRRLTSLGVHLEESHGQGGRRSRVGHDDQYYYRRTFGSDGSLLRK
jgi:chromosome segregation ATPase